LPSVASEQHRGTSVVVEAVPLFTLQWSMLCVAVMKPATHAIEPLATPRKHKLLVGAGTPPGWVDSWVKGMPLVGVYLNLVIGVARSTTELEDVADFMAEDLESGSGEWMGKKVGIKQR